MATTAARAGLSLPGVISALGITQILAWGSTYYLLAVLAASIGQTTGWPLTWIMSGLSVGLLISGMIAPLVGRTIDRHGGRAVLAASAILLAAGLAGLSLSAGGFLPYLGSWVVIGIGMGCGLYDAAFSSLGRLYGAGARSAITALTLWGGFASTVCWPVTAFLADRLGWQGTCLAYAALHLTLALPLYLFAIPSGVPPVLAQASAPSGPNEIAPGLSPVAGHTASWLFIAMAAAFTISAIVGSVIAAHLLILLQARDLTLAAAVALGALLGPSQVGARVIEFMVGRRYHPAWTLLMAALLMVAGLGLQLAGLPAIALGVGLYGAGVGLMSIVRGTLPLVVFGPAGFATLMGRLAMPSLIAQSIAPMAAALVLDRFGATAALAVLTGLAAVNLLVGAALWRWSRLLRARGTAADDPRPQNS